MRSVPRIPKARRFVQTESGAESRRATGAGNLACRAWRRRIPFRSASFRQKLPKWWTQKVSPVVRIFPSTKLFGEKAVGGWVGNIYRFTFEKVPGSEGQGSQAIADGIIDVEQSTFNTQRSTNTVYDLQGRKVSVMKPGLYIVNGKKVIVK